jgi:hypothetical protein
MAQNPLQQYFRQPKIFISLPSHGAYNRPGFVDGDVDRIPVFGMTGMDEILVKTPDALLTGESTVKVIASCCPAIKEPWNLSIIDLDIILTAIRIATYGSVLELTQVCSKCGTEHDYDFELSKFIDYYTNCTFNNRVIVSDLTILLRPLSYKQSSDFSLRNFQMQQQLKQVNGLEDEDEKKRQLSTLYETLATLQNDILVEGIESVDVSTTKVTERGFIKEWVENCDTELLAAIKQKIQENQVAWRSPSQQVVCDNCGHVSYLNISLDQADFFADA